MNRCIELHDSDLASATPRAGALELLLDPAYVHQSQGEPGVDAGTGWAQRFVVRIHGYSLDSPIPPLPDTISDGTLQIGTEILDNVIPLPLRTELQVHLRLQLSHSGLVVDVRGTGIEVEELGEPRYIEQFTPSSQEPGT